MEATSYFYETEKNTIRVTDHGNVFPKRLKFTENRSLDCSITHRYEIRECLVNLFSREEEDSRAESLVALLEIGIDVSWFDGSLASNTRGGLGLFNLRKWRPRNTSPS